MLTENSCVFACFCHHFGTSVFLTSIGTPFPHPLFQWRLVDDHYKSPPVRLVAPRKLYNSQGCISEGNFTFQPLIFRHVSFRGSKQDGNVALMFLYREITIVHALHSLKLTVGP